MKLILIWLNNLDVSILKAIKYLVKKVHSGRPHIVSAANDLSSSDKVVYDRCEFCYYDATTVSGENDVYCSIPENSVM